MVAAVIVAVETAAKGVNTAVNHFPIFKVWDSVEFHTFLFLSHPALRVCNIFVLVRVEKENFFMEQHIEIEGRILAVLAGTMFRVELTNKHQVLAHISGKMRKRFIRLTVGDRVRMEMSPYDLDKARIVYRLQ